MNIISGTLSGAKKERLLQRFARFGLASKGVVYCLMGVLTVLAALGLNSQKGNKNEAFKVVYDQPFGKVLLIIIAIGLCGYVTLRVFQAFFDIDDKGKDAKGIFTRLGYGASAILYLGLVIYAIKLASGNPGGGDSKQFFISKIMEYPMGEWIIGIAGLIVIGSGINQIYKGWSKKFMKRVQLYQSDYRNTFQKAGIAGYIARGLVFSIIGYFLFRAALDSNPAEAEGTDAAFSFLQQNFGNVLMGVVALGLVLYGIFMFVRARYERIHFSQ
ncbi:MAG TPA: DUF1206 domain-containing protein [Chryseosolibacter sp.]